MTIVGSCGETKERTAARVHQIAAGLWLVEAIAAAVLAVVGIAIVAVSRPAIQWHRNSTATHERRAIERGES